MKFQKATYSITLKNVVRANGETAGFRKPDPRIFQLAIDRAGVHTAESLMIGDNLAADIGGARNFGMDQVFFNPKRLAHTEEVTFEMEALQELKNPL